ncbi:hypothetical protein MA13_contig00002-0206 [Edwardsiella piscicida]|nr:hypothetical protein MA13_contig00002-0206 [Edwardsiella piscicida]
MSHKGLSASFLTVILLLAGYFTLILNIPILLHFYRILHALGEYRLGFALSIPVVLFAALTCVFMPFSFRPILKPFFILLLVITALASYAQYKYQVIFDRSMIENIFETNSAEAGSYLNIYVIAWVLLAGVLPALLLLRTRIIYGHNVLLRLGIRLLAMLISLLIIALVACLYYQDYASVGRNNRSLNLETQPASYLYSTGQYINRRYLTTPMPFRKVGEDAKLVEPAGEKPTLVFVILGETARAQNQSLGGYPRETNPYSAKQPGLIYFRNVTSCGTATAISVPCMFSNLTREHYDGNIARNSDSVIDVLHRAGVTTFWRDNDEGCKGACDRTPNELVSTKADNPLCNGKTCYDEVMLNNLQQKIPDDGKSKLLVFHLIGSHGPTYYLRYPARFRVFMSDCERSDIENCTQQQLVNTYDNTLVYTDYVVNQFIERLKTYEKQYNVALYYVSDHGESLGEKGLYLHGTPYQFAPAEQTHVPMSLWLSDGYAKANRINLQCLQEAARDGSFSHDNLFPTLLSMMHVTTSAANPQLDILQRCRN